MFVSFSVYETELLLLKWEEEESFCKVCKKQLKIYLLVKLYIVLHLCLLLFYSEIGTRNGNWYIYIQFLAHRTFLYIFMSIAKSFNIF